MLGLWILQIPPIDMNRPSIHWSGLSTQSTLQSLSWSPLILDDQGHVKCTVQFVVKTLIPGFAAWVSEKIGEQNSILLIKTTLCWEFLVLPPTTRVSHCARLGSCWTWNRLDSLTTCLSANMVLSVCVVLLRAASLHAPINQALFALSMATCPPWYFVQFKFSCVIEGLAWTV